MLGLLLSFAAMNFLEKAPVFQNEFDFQLPVAGVALVVTATIACLVILNNQAMRFACEFRKAPRVSRHAYLSERLLGTLVAQDNKPVFLHLSAIIPFGLAAYLCRAAITSSRPLLVIAIAVLPLTIYAAWRLGLLFLYWRFRRAHGRAPTSEDLQPV
jgi:hypothetical protein